MPERPSQRRRVKTPALKVSRKARPASRRIVFKGAHPLVRAQWDRSLTVRQNYARMGLVASLAGPAGGADATPAEAARLRAKEDAAAAAADDDDDDGTPAASARPSGQVEFRSFEDFAALPAVALVPRPALRPLTADGERDDATIAAALPPAPLAVAVGSRSAAAVAAAAAASAAVTDAPPAAPAPVSRRKRIDPLPVDVAAALEEEVRSAPPRPPRFASSNETAVLRDLVQRHGTNLSAMARDRHLNTFQLTEGQLRRKLRIAGMLPAEAKA
ncbi:hypothetical protein HK405_001026 [Cladochytrium tenue]|nr:hypothetical protein HK405_001026 [Cladochytrium tenue]